MFFSKNKVKKKKLSGENENHPEEVNNKQSSEPSEEVFDESLDSILSSIRSISAGEDPVDESPAEEDDTPERKDPKIETFGSNYGRPDEDSEPLVLTTIREDEAEEDEPEEDEGIRTEAQEPQEPEEPEPREEKPEPEGPTLENLSEKLSANGDMEGEITDTLEALVRELIKEKIYELNETLEELVRQMIQSRLENLDSTIETMVRQMLNELLKKHLPGIVRKVAAEELKQFTRRR